MSTVHPRMRNEYYCHPKTDPIKPFVSFRQNRTLPISPSGSPHFVPSVRFCHFWSHVESEAALLLQVFLYLLYRSFVAISSAVCARPILSILSEQIPSIVLYVFSPSVDIQQSLNSLWQPKRIDSHRPAEQSVKASSIHSRTMQHELGLHMPKLQYRTRNSPRPDSIGSVSAGFSSGTVSTAPTSLEFSDLSPSPTLAKAVLQNSSPQHQLASTVPPSTVSRNTKLKDSQRRKSSFFGGFFSVKEPSQQAFEDYQRQLRRKGACKDGRVNAIGMPGVSSAKLPPTVPKVNSRWDGVPQAVKEKEKQNPAHPQSPGNTRSIWSSSGSRKSGSTTSSTHSRSSSYQSLAEGLQCQSASSLSDMCGWEAGSGYSVSSAKMQDKVKSPTSVTSAYQPNLRAPQPPPLSPSIPEECMEQNLPDAGALLGPPTGRSSPLDYSNRSPPISTTISPSKQYSHAPSGLATKADFKTATLEEPLPNTIFVNSNDLNVLGSSPTARQKGKVPVFPAGPAEDSIPNQDSPSQPALKTETIPRGLSQFVHANTSSFPNSVSRDIAPWGDPPPPTGKHSPRARSFSATAPALDVAQKSRKKSMMALFGR